MRRRLLAMTLLSVTTILLVSFFLLLNGPKEPFRANYDKIQMGMTIEEVEAILGKPRIVSNLYFGDKNFRDSYIWRFSDDDGIQHERPSIHIGFAEGHAVDKSYDNRTTWDVLKSAYEATRRTLGIW